MNPDTPTRQFVAVKFRSSDTKTWTYHNDGPPVACGDIVKVPDRFGKGWQRATVHSFSATFPQFPTKPILGRLDDQPAGQLPLGDQ